MLMVVARNLLAKSLKTPKFVSQLRNRLHDTFMCHFQLLKTKTFQFHFPLKQDLIIELFWQIKFAINI